MKKYMRTFCVCVLFILLNVSTNASKLECVRYGLGSNNVKSSMKEPITISIHNPTKVLIFR